MHYMSPFTWLIALQSEEEHKRVTTLKQELLGNVLKDIQPWSMEEGTTNKEHLWCEEIFEQIAGRFGEIIKFDDEAMTGARIDRFKALVLTSSKTEKTSEISIEVGALKYKATINTMKEKTKKAKERRGRRDSRLRRRKHNPQKQWRIRQVDQNQKTPPLPPPEGITTTNWLYHFWQERRQAPLSPQIRKKQGTMSLKGLGSASKRALVRETLRKNKTKLALLQETKLSQITSALARDIWYQRRPTYIEIGAMGSSGGLVAFWDCRELELIQSEAGNYTLALKFKELTKDTVWTVLVVYGPTAAAQRQEFWDEIAALISLWDLPWMLGGDFNVIRFPTEKKGGT
ncbi:hypothetical protein H6P81_003178 [Aristolochia fimbriata]|uniref:Endonuclease/exonuclease/phosphatase domain-containing protein n=1 Tax=Aristolochia fimbriata TaxID=158543 RepID=A0AAV7FBU5_ARIFI|nr:hypothetical protein H6P81_003178 [Aristolochia fimbriata]